MEEVKVLLDLLKALPDMAIWALVLIYGYKVAIVGSIYAVIRFVSSQLFDWLRTKKVEYKEIRPMLDGMAIHCQVDPLIAQLNRIRGKGLTVNSEYIHWQSVDWLRQAIDDKIAKDNQVK